MEHKRRGWYLKPHYFPGSLGSLKSSTVTADQLRCVVTSSLSLIESLLHCLCITQPHSVRLKKDLYGRKRNPQHIPSKLHTHPPKRRKICYLISSQTWMSQLTNGQGCSTLNMCAHTHTHTHSCFVPFTLSFQGVGSGLFASWFIKPKILTIWTSLSKFAYRFSKPCFSNRSMNQNYLDFEWTAELYFQTFWVSE